MMHLVQKYGQRGALVDTNILLLFFVGAFDRTLVPRFKRTQQFAEEDYDTALKMLASFSPIVTTPHILTEVSNLAGQLPEHQKSGFFAKFGDGISLLEEHHVPGIDLATAPKFNRFGITDVAVKHIAERGYLVITDDFRLSQYLQSVDIDAINFNHVRTYNWT